jgi:hypothetical protein
MVTGLRSRSFLKNIGNTRDSDPKYCYSRNDIVLGFHHLLRPIETEATTNKQRGDDKASSSQKAREGLQKFGGFVFLKRVDDIDQRDAEPNRQLDDVKLMIGQE